MPTVTTPGVYIREVPGARPFNPLGTSTAGFFGPAERGPIDRAVPVTSFAEFQRVFGGFLSVGVSKLAYCVWQFFAEGGSRAYIARAIAAGNPTPASTTLTKQGSDDDCCVIAASSVGMWGENISVTIAHEPTERNNDARFTLSVFYGEETAPVEKYEHLSLNPDDPISAAYYLPNAVASSEYLSVAIADGVAITEIPEEVQKEPLTGANEVNSGFGDEHYIGENGAIHLFDSLDDLDILAVADLSASGVNTAIEWCKNRQDCFCIASNTVEGTDGAGVLTERTTYGDSPYGALYYPWLEIDNPSGGTETIQVPPVGAVAGIYARTDAARGVHKAPAGVLDGAVRSALGVTRSISDVEQEQYNPKGINCIRVLPNAGITVWGSRTLAQDAQWRYIPVRRLVTWIEKTIRRGIRYAVFEGNTPALWGALKRDITAFLSTVWRDGGLTGAKEEEAFFVKVDEDNNPPAQRDMGILAVDVGLAPVRPAEFIIVTIRLEL